ncbi:MAG: sialidase family protein [Oscillospiraceae bacterium]|nr:sialidase family protein [Oscillospiraceae bacterium]
MIYNLSYYSTPLADIRRERYIPYPCENTGSVLTHYVISPDVSGRGAEIGEILRTQSSSDNYLLPKTRFSGDNGCTFSEWCTDETLNEEWKNTSMVTHEICRLFAPESGLLLRFTLRRIFIGDAEKALYTQDGYFDHSFCEYSRDGGKSFFGLHILKYEPGADYDPENRLDPEFLTKNQMYSGYSAVTDTNGNVITSGCVNTILDGETVTGVAVMKGVYDRKSAAYKWREASRVAVPLSVSSRGLMEPWMVSLSDGRLLLEMRGSSTPSVAGRRWISVSEDNGETWDSVRAMTYSDAAPFWSPSTFSRILRHSRTGKLYWFGNISPTLPDGNWPRRPLCIAQLDENTCGLIKETKSDIDDYFPGYDSTDMVQFSNFSLREDVETGEFCLYLSRYGERGGLDDGGKYFECDVFEYRIKLKETIGR